MAKETTDVNGRRSRSACAWILLIFIVLSVCDTIPVMRLCIAHEERIRTVQVGKAVPHNFPVLVFASSDKNGHSTPAIVFYSKLKEYLKAHPDYSFTLPKAQVKQVNTELGKYDYDSGYGVGKFTMTERGGKQFFKVEGSWDDDRVNIGWYAADKRSFAPGRYVTYFGPGLCMKCILQITFGNIMASFIVVGIFRAIKELCRAVKNGIKR